MVNSGRYGSNSALRSLVLRGGVYLAARQGGGMLVGFVGAVALTRLIGPSAFGVYVTLITIYTFLQTVATMGVDVYLVRTPEPLTKRTMDIASSLIVVLAVACATITALLLPTLESLMGMPDISRLGGPMLLLIPVSALSHVPLAKLEKELRYRSVALVEGTAQVLLYAVALPLALREWGAGAGVAAWMVQQLFLAVVLFVAADYRPRACLDLEKTAEMVRYGAGFSASLWIWKLRELVNPVIVGRYAGPAAVGLIALAIRLVDNLAFVKRATWRMSIAVLARIQGDPHKLRTAIEEGMCLQLLALGPLLVLFACFGPRLLSVAFGPEWVQVIVVFPFIAIACLANAMFNLHSSGLYAVRQNWQVARFHIVHVVVFASSAILLVPRFGLRGYGYAELAALVAYALIHASGVRSFGSPAYALPVVWFLAFAVALFVQATGWWALCGVAAIACWPKTWEQLRASLTGAVLR